MKYVLFLLLCANMAFAQKCIPFVRLDTFKTMMQDASQAQANLSQRFTFLHTPDIYKTPNGVLYDVYTKKIGSKKVEGERITKDSIVHTFHYWEPKTEVKWQGKGILIPPENKTITVRGLFLPYYYWVKNHNSIQQLDDFSIHLFLTESFQYSCNNYGQVTVKPACVIIGADSIVLDSATLKTYYILKHKPLYNSYILQKTLDCIIPTLQDTFYTPRPLPKDAVLYKKGRLEYWYDFPVFDKKNQNLCVAIVLKQKGYYNGAIKSKWTPKMQAALRKYQKGYGLAVGKIDLETLNTLNISPN